jgi:nickel-dependent lactate racemase
MSTLDILIDLPYGTGTVPLRVPADRARLVELSGHGEPQEPLGAFWAAMADPVDSPPLEELCRGRSVCYLLDDGTRAEPHEEFMRAVLERLGPARTVQAVVCTGSHEVDSEANRRICARFRELADELALCSTRILIHDCEDAGAHVELGTTSRGTPVAIQREALEADILVITSDLKNHYFAGYSNPVKNVLPGVCAFAGIEHNHSLALDPRSTFGHHPWHPDPGRRKQPVAEDMLEGARMAIGDRPAFVLGSITTAKGCIWSAAGDIQAVAALGMAEVDSAASVRVEASPFLIVSAGGDPEDETLYNAQRGLELSRNGVRDGGEVLFVAQCGKGVAPTPMARAEFYDRLTAPLDEVIAGLQQDYVLYSHKAFKFARFIRSVSAIRMLTDLPEDVVAAAHMSKAEDAQSVVDRWLSESDSPILITPHANKTALLA